jgi:hypothetical protein
MIDLLLSGNVFPVLIHRIFRKPYHRRQTSDGRIADIGEIFVLAMLGCICNLSYVSHILTPAAITI